MRAALLLLFTLLLANAAGGQGSNSAQFGVLRTTFKKESPYKPAFWPGFSINAFGFSVSYFAGYNKPLVVDPVYKSGTVGGNFFDMGYKYEFQKLSPFKKKINRPFLYPTLGAGLGSYSLNGRSGFQFNVRPGIKLAIIPGVALYAEAYTGFNILDDEFDDIKETSVKGSFFIPAFGIEFKTNLQNVLNEVWGPKVELAEGWVTNNYKDKYGVVYSYSYYREKGQYVQEYFANSRNVLNLYGTGLLGTGQATRGQTLAGGAGLALRWGMFAFDLEYVLGKIGYRYMDGDERMQNNWNMRRFGFLAGIDILRWHKAFQPPGFFRIIMGVKLGVQSLTSNLNNFSQTMIGVGGFDRQDLQNKFYATGYIGIEYGTLGFSIENFRLGQEYSSGMVVAARYMIPLVMRHAN